MARDVERSARGTRSASLCPPPTGRAPPTHGSRVSGLLADEPWYVEIALDAIARPAAVTYSGDSDTRFHLNVYPEEWGIFFCHGSRASWIRVTDQPFVHGRDDYALIAELPELAEIGALVQVLEGRYGMVFQRDQALIRTNMTDGNSAVSKWLSSL